MSSHLNMEIYLDVVGCIKWMVDQVANQLEAEQSLIALFPLTTNNLKHKWTSSQILPRPNLDYSSQVFSRPGFKKISDMIDNVTTDSIRAIKIAPCSNWMIRFRFQFIRPLWSRNQISLIFSVNFVDVLGVFLLMTAFRQMNIPQFQDSSMDTGQSLQRAYTPKSVVPEIDNYLIQGTQRTQPFFFAAVTQNFQVHFEPLDEELPEIAPTVLIPSQENVQVNDRDLNFDEIDEIKQEDDREKSSCKKIHLNENQRFIEFVPVMLNLVRNTGNIIATQSNLTQPRRDVVGSSQFAPNQFQNPPLKRRLFMRLGLSKKQKLISHLHDNLKPL